MQPICTHKISIQSSKPSHAYPIIRLPREFRELAGASAEIYQTSYEGGIAFLVKIVDRSKKKLSKGSNFEKEPSHGGGRRFESARAHWFLRSFERKKCSAELSGSRLCSVARCVRCRQSRLSYGAADSDNMYLFPARLPML